MGYYFRRDLETRAAGRDAEHEQLVAARHLELEAQRGRPSERVSLWQRIWQRLRRR